MTELALLPDTYYPTITEDGAYIDYKPIRTVFTHGLMCGCGTETVFYASSNFGLHCKTNKHQRWLSYLEQQKGNVETENKVLKETINQLKNQIIEQNRQINGLKMEISSLNDYLRIKLINEKNDTSTINLIDF